MPEGIISEIIGNKLMVMIKQHKQMCKIEKVTKELRERVRKVTNF